MGKQENSSIGEVLDYTHRMAEYVIDEWNEGVTVHFPDCEELSSIEELLRFSHRYELECRRLAQNMPCLNTTLVCMVIYSEIVYGEYKALHGRDFLHLYVAEAIRILQYAAGPEREEQLLTVDSLLELLRNVEVMMGAREYASILATGLIRFPQELHYRDGSFFMHEEDREFLIKCRDHYSGKGLRFRMADDTTALLFAEIKDFEKKELRFTGALRELLEGRQSEAGKAILKDTYYRYFPQMQECDSDYAEFLTGLIHRVEFIVEFMQNTMRECIEELGVSREAVTYIWNSAFEISSKTDVPQDMIYNPKFKRYRLDQDTHEGITWSPVIRGYNGNYITCFSLCGDALNSWIEKTLYEDEEKCRWKGHIRQKLEDEFEDEVIAYMRQQGYMAGHLSENGQWRIEAAVYEEPLHIILPGEVDVFAMEPRKRVAYLIECKRLHDIGMADRAYQKLKNNRNNIVQKYAPKLMKKRAVLQEYLKENYPDYTFYTAIVTDVDFPVYVKESARCDWKEKIAVCSFERLKQAAAKGMGLETEVYGV